MTRRLAAASLLIALTTSPLAAADAQLTDQQAEAAKAIGEAGRARDVFVTCSSAKMKESFRHPGLPVVEMRISGPAGDIATQAFDAKRLYQPLDITDEIKAWHLTAFVHPTTFGVVQQIAIRGASGAAVPADRFVAGPPVGGRIDGIGIFSGDAAHAIVSGGDFSIVAVLNAGERSCDVNAKDRMKMGF